MIERENLCERAIVLGERFRSRAALWQERFSQIGDVRGLGAMQAIELVKGCTSTIPAADEAKQVIQWCYERGVIVIGAGTYGNVIRFLAPLVISDDEFDEALSVLEEGLEATFPSTAFALDNLRELSDASF